MSSVMTERGFSLLEVLVAISIFSIGLLAVATMQVSAIHGNRLSNAVTQASCLAEMQLEALKAADINSADLAAGNYQDPNNPIDENGANGGIFNRSWVVTDQTTLSKALTVTVRWNDAGKPKSLVLRSLTRGGGY